MGTVAEIVDKYLPMFDKDDPIYQALISYIEGVANPTLNNPQDYNIGAIASTLEWNRNLSLCLKDQLFLNLATGKYLDIIAHDHLGIYRYSGENDADYVARIQDFIIGHKVTPGAIIYAMRPYSPGAEPIIREGETDGAFADWSFASNYKMFKVSSGTWSGYSVFPALAQSADAQAFFFILILNDTDPADIPAILDAMRRLVAAGIEYEIQIEH